jgi:hypothetical protein
VKPNWLDFVDVRSRFSLLEILVELSRLRRKKNVDFVVIGALPLLINGYLQYTALWDIDLLFRDEEEMKEFTNRPKSKMLRIVDYDDALMVSENIASFHSAWTFDKNWFNVDYILQNELFEFYANDITHSAPFNSIMKWKGTAYEISLYMAHPWDIIVDKIISPRTERDISLRVDTSIDIRHIFAIYRFEKDNNAFWRHVTTRARFFCPMPVFKKKFLDLIRKAHELGYEDIKISSTTAQALGI